VTAPGAPARAQSAVVAANAGQLGAWSAPMSWPIVAAHMSVLPSTEVITWVSSDVPGDTERHRVYLWNPKTGVISSDIGGQTHNVFCSGHTFLTDGRLLVAGGHIADNKGLKQADLFNFAAVGSSNVWEKAASMNAGRWYPTATMLGTGEVAVVAGADENASGNAFPEVFNGTTKAWRLLRGAPLNMPYYPWSFSAPDGRMFVAGPDRATRYLNPTAGGQWSAPVMSAEAFREWGTAVMYQPGKIMIAGGGAALPAASAEVIDLNAGAAAAWKPTGSMNHRRKHLNAVMLPDGKVLVVGGTSGPGFNDEDAAVLAAEMWNPATGAWTTLASMAKKRQYHSTAVLLADGRVLVAGGGRCGGCVVNNFDAELYSPPYLFKTDGTAATRPAITAAPTEVDFGQQFAVQTPSPTGVARVTLVRLPSTTHAFNQNQAFDTLAIASRTTGAVQVVAPANARRMPPGHYMLFVLNAAGVPSEAKIVRLRGTAAAYPAPPIPAAPSALRADPTSDTQVRLQWTDNSTGETDFLIERCQGATCSTFTQVATVGADVITTSNDGLTAATTYRYRARARNDAGASAYTAPISVTTLGTSQAGGGAVVNRASLTCMDVWGGAAAQGATVGLYSCAGTANQSWVVPATGVAGEVRVFKNMCLDASGGTGKDGDPIVIWGCSTTAPYPNHVWTYTAAGELRGINSKCVTVAANTALVLGPCTGATNQRWDPAGRATDQPPVAQFTFSCTGRQCMFNSSASTDDRGIASRSWDFGDGGSPVDVGNAVEAFRSYNIAPTERQYAVTLTVTDGAGQRGQLTRTVTIPGIQPPTAAFTHTCTGLTCTFTDQSADADGTIVTRRWSWGDGKDTTVSATSASHTYATGGDRTVALTVTDDDGATATASAVVRPTAPGAAAVAVINRASLTCMDVWGASPTWGSTVGLYTCVNVAKQAWVVPPTGVAGEVRILNNMCLDASGGAGKDGDPIVIWGCSTTAPYPNHVWTYTAAGELRGINSKCVTVAANTALVLGPCTGATNQRWNLGPAVAAAGASAKATPD
jgi:PKD repeat protein